MENSGVSIRHAYEGQRGQYSHDPHRCLAFYGIAAVHIFELQVLARDKHDTAAAQVHGRQTILALFAMPIGPGRIGIRCPPTISAFQG